MWGAVTGLWGNRSSAGNQSHASDTEATSRFLPDFCQRESEEQGESEVQRGRKGKRKREQGEGGTERRQRPAGERKRWAASGWPESLGAASSAAGPLPRPAPGRGRVGSGGLLLLPRLLGDLRFFCLSLRWPAWGKRAPAPSEYPGTPGRHPSRRPGSRPQELVPGLGKHSGTAASEDSVYPRISRAGQGLSFICAPCYASSVSSVPQETNAISLSQSLVKMQPPASSSSLLRGPFSGERGAGATETETVAGVGAAIMALQTLEPGRPMAETSGRQPCVDWDTGDWRVPVAGLGP